MPVIYEKREKRGKIWAEAAAVEGRVHKLQLPAEVLLTDAEGRTSVLPVASVGRHVFDENAELQEVCLPSSVTEIGPFAFYRCRNLERITMYDSVTEYYDGAIRENRKLKEICVHVETGNYRILKDILSDNTEVLHFHLFLPEGEARLTFPAYHNEDWEDTYARAIHPKIVGAGYAYREHVSRTGIDFGGYDRDFVRAETEPPEVTAGIALDRLAFPLRLDAEARERYRSYLTGHAEEILRVCIAEDDRESLAVLLRHGDVEDTVLDGAIRLASDGGHTEICGMLMEFGRVRQTSAPEPELFSMEDL